MSSLEAQIKDFSAPHPELVTAWSEWSWEDDAAAYAKLDEARLILESEGCDSDCLCSIKAAVNCVVRDQKWTLSNLLRHGRYFHKASLEAAAQLLAQSEAASAKVYAPRARELDRRVRDI